MKVLIITAILAIEMSSPAFAGEADSLHEQGRGLLFTASFWPAALSFDGQKGTAGDFAAVVGYRMGSVLEPWMAFLTGHHTVPGIAGRLAFGGFAAGASAHLLPRAVLQPVLSVFFQTGTLLAKTGTGYDQAGYRFALGGWLGLSRNFALQAQMMYGRDYRTRQVGDASPGKFPEATESTGAILTVVFYPQIFP